MGKLYSDQKLQAAVRRSESEAASRPASRVSEAAGDLRATRDVPMEIYQEHYSPHGQGRDPADRDFAAHLERKYPSIKIPYSSGKITVGPLNRHKGPVKIKTRFGTATRYYPDGKGGMTTRA